MTIEINIQNVRFGDVYEDKVSYLSKSVLFDKTDSKFVLLANEEHKGIEVLVNPKRCIIPLVESSYKGNSFLECLSQASKEQNELVSEILNYGLKLEVTRKNGTFENLSENIKKAEFVIVSKPSTWDEDNKQLNVCYSIFAKFCENPLA